MTESSEFLDKIKGLAEPVAAREGCEIYGIEWVSGSHGKGRTLRVYIDKVGGVSLDDCANVSRGLNLILDVDDAVPGSGYSLEVSSPGLERALWEPRHFKNAVGSLIHVKLREARDNLKVFKGRLAELSEGADSGSMSASQGDKDCVLVFNLENSAGAGAPKKQIRVNVGEIAKARIVFEEEKGLKRGQRKS